MDKTDGQIAELLKKLGDVGFDNAEAFLEAAMRGTYWDGVVQLSVFGVLTVTIVIAIALLIWSFVKDNELWPFCIAYSAFVGLIAIITALAENPWLKVFDPEAALYKAILVGAF